MKILIAADWHGQTEWAVKVIELAAKHNIKTIFQLGDFGWWHGPAGEVYIRTLSKALVEKNIELFWEPGNHEWWDDIDQFPGRFEKTSEGFYGVAPNIFYMGKVNSWKWCNKKFAAIGGAVSIDRHLRKVHESWWPQEQLTNNEVQQAKQIGKIDYLFTHDCPQAHPFKYLVNDLESENHRWKMTDIAKVLDPMLWFHGHMHRPAKYSFGPDCTVYGLDCDGSIMRDHVKMLDIDSGEVTNIEE